MPPTGNRPLYNASNLQGGLSAHAEFDHPIFPPSGASPMKRTPGTFPLIALTLCAGLTAALPMIAAAQDSKEAKASAATLSVGDAAPAIKIDKWVKGDEVKSFEKGKVYVVEFWATWCGPCRESIPHLSQLQKDNKALTIIGVAASERKEQDDSDNRLDKLSSFVAKQGDAMGYRIAYDGDRDMSTAWMKAAKQDTIPTAFIVNGEGKVAWIGTPFEIDEPLAAIASGKWDITKAAGEAKKKDEARAAAMSKGKASAASFKKFTELLTSDEKAAYALAKKASETDAKDDAMLLNNYAWAILDTKELKSPDYAIAYDIAKRGDEVSKGENWMYLDTFALATFKKGDAAKAIELQNKAIALAKKEKNLPEGAVEEMQGHLNEFKKSSK